MLHIDEDAYKILSEYLEKLSSHFKDDPAKEEIMADIEFRIAELLSEKLSSKEQAVNIEHITEIIGIMGKPEDFGSEAEENSETADKTKKKHKRLYRNPDDKILGGVASGLAAYLNTDPTLVRILLVILGFLSLASASSFICCFGLSFPKRKPFLKN